MSTRAWGVPLPPAPGPPAGPRRLPGAPGAGGGARTQPAPPRGAVTPRPPRRPLRLHSPRSSHRRAAERRPRWRPFQACKWDPDDPSVRIPCSRSPGAAASPLPARGAAGGAGARSARSEAEARGGHGSRRRSPPSPPPARPPGPVPPRGAPGPQRPSRGGGGCTHHSRPSALPERGADGADAGLGLHINSSWPGAPLLGSSAPPSAPRLPRLPSPGRGGSLCLPRRALPRPGPGALRRLRGYKGSGERERPGARGRRRLSAECGADSQLQACFY